MIEDRTFRSPKTARTTPVEIVRCAIYTRKSTTEGLDSEFSTLDAQREACEAYIASQRMEGWMTVSDRYDDGGFTGGNTDRPALTQLIDDIQNKKIDCVVVYKVDRLSRSLLDFAKLMEVFDLHQVAFVSITQQFNTATSMGRLVLNVLLSFAQFERDIISERTSDKMCAARRKGKLLGSTPVLGYNIDRDKKRLVLNPREVRMVKSIFALYLEKETMRKVAEEVNRRGWRTKSHVSKAGKRRQGHAFSKTDIQRIVTNVTYIGKIAHKGMIVQGEQPAIVDEATFKKAQSLVKSNTHSGPKPYRHKHNALLKKLLRCGNCGAAMGHTYAIKNKTRLYHYYLCTTNHKLGKDACDTSPLPAREIEDFVVDMIKRIGQDRALSERAFAETVTRQKARIAELYKKQSLLQQCQQRLDEEIEHLITAIRDSAEPPTTLLNELRRAEEKAGQTELKLKEIEGELAELQSETLDKSRLIDALTRFWHLWDTLFEQEKHRLLRDMLSGVIYDPETEEVTLELCGS